MTVTDGTLLFFLIQKYFDPTIGRAIRDADVYAFEPWNLVEHAEQELDYCFFREVRPGEPAVRRNPNGSYEQVGRAENIHDRTFDIKAIKGTFRYHRYGTIPTNWMLYEYWLQADQWDAHNLPDHGRVFAVYMLKYVSS